MAGVVFSVNVLLFNILLLSLLITVASSSSADQTCSDTAFLGIRVFKSCRDLPSLGARLHWNYDLSINQVSIAYRAKKISQQGWIAWAINPTGTGMVGSQALVALRDTDGSMRAYTTSITSYNPSMLPVEKLSFMVSNISSEYSNGEMIIYAVLGPLDHDNHNSNDGSKRNVVNHVWQSGNSVSSDNVPLIHSMSPQNLQSMGKIDFYLD